MINPTLGRTVVDLCTRSKDEYSALGSVLDFDGIASWWRSVCVLLCFPWRSEQTGSREEPLDASAIVTLVQTFYDQTKTLQADFEQTRYTRLYDRYDRAQGAVVFKKPGKMRWDYAEPNGQVFVSDGKRLLIYQPPEEGEKRGQLIERGLEQDQLPSAFSFLIGGGDLDKDFEVRLLEHDDAKFKDGHVLQLIPRKPTPTTSNSSSTSARFRRTASARASCSAYSSSTLPAIVTASTSRRSSSTETSPTSASTIGRPKAPSGRPSNPVSSARVGDR